MEGRSPGVVGFNARPLLRCFECSRVEDELWIRAFELMCPWIKRRVLPEARPTEEQRAKARPAVGKGA